ncbi:MAG: hypothetical protein HC901_00130 [Bdellovibrionaceae bacterium]|nr:hypothetical protein [Pseudobdellovibrionaceae bacterium]
MQIVKKMITVIAALKSFGSISVNISGMGWVKSACLLIWLFVAVPAYSTVTVTDLKCEYLTNPLGIDVSEPRLSWKSLDSNNTRGQQQTAFQVLVASSEANLNADIGDLWDSGKTAGSDSVHIRYAGVPLDSGQNCYWKVRIWDKDDTATDWSPTARFSMGLLAAGDWNASWIRLSSADINDHIWYRKQFFIGDTVTKAFAYVGSFGYHELYVNGQKVGDEVLVPSVMNLDTRVPYVTYDITGLLQTGDNIVAIWSGPGWALFNGFSAGDAKVIGQVDITTNSSAIQVVTDTTWKARVSSSKHLGRWKNSNFGGDEIDARLHIPGWNAVGFNDSGWSNPAVYSVAKRLPPR